MARRTARSTQRPRPPRGGNTSPSDSAVRERILSAFSDRARRSGIRAVLMGELASELRMSAMTLYKHFASKDELVAAMVDAWALDLMAVDSLQWEKANSCSAVLDALLVWADAWTASLSHVSPAFFDDLRRDHPESWARFNAHIRAGKRVAIQYLTPFLRDDIHQAAALAFLDHLVMLAAQPRFAERAGISRREAVRTALNVWGGGALRKRTTLRAM